jgi:hypothetical protein
MGNRGVEFSFSGEGQVAGECECGNEPSVTIKRAELLDSLRTC